MPSPEPGVGRAVAQLLLVRGHDRARLAGQAEQGDHELGPRPGPAGSSWPRRCWYAAISMRTPPILMDIPTVPSV